MQTITRFLDAYCNAVERSGLAFLLIVGTACCVAVGAIPFLLINAA